MDILLLRNQDDLQKSIDNIKKHHRHAHIHTAPLFRTRLHKIPEHIKACAVITTSKNALRALKASQIKSDKPLFVLGKSSCAYAKELGFKDVIFGGANAWQLAEKIKEYESVYSALYYLHGDVTRFDIKKYLSYTSQQDIRKICAYSLEKIDNPFKNLDPDFFMHSPYVFIYSYRQATCFLEEIGQTSNLNAICISAKVASCLKDSDFISVQIASKPTESAMIALIK